MYIYFFPDANLRCNNSLIMIEMPQPIYGKPPPFPFLNPMVYMLLHISGDIKTHNARKFACKPEYSPFPITL